MDVRKLWTVAAVSLVLATPAGLAQRSQDGTRLVRAERLIEAEIDNAEGDQIAQIQDLLLDPARARIAYVILEAEDAFDGLGALPFQALQLSADDDAIIIRLDDATLKSAKTFGDDWKKIRQLGTEDMDPEARKAAQEEDGDGEAGAKLPRRVSKILDREVIDQADEDAGELVDLVIDADSGRVVHLVIEHDDVHYAIESGRVSQADDDKLKLPLAAASFDRLTKLEPWPGRLDQSLARANDNDRDGDRRGRRDDRDRENDTRGAGRLYKAHDIRELTIANESGEEIARVKELVVDFQEQRIPYIVVVHTDKEDRFFAVPIEDIRFEQGKKEKTRLVADMKDLRAAQSFNRDDWQEAKDLLNTRPSFADAGDATRDNPFEGTAFERVDKLVASELVNRWNGEKLGTIQEIVFDPARQGRVEFVVVEADDKLHAVPIDRLRPGAGRSVQAEFNARELATAPSFEKGNWPDLADRSFVREVDTAFADVARDGNRGDRGERGERRGARGDRDGDVAQGGGRLPLRLRSDSSVAYRIDGAAAGDAEESDKGAGGRRVRMGGQATELRLQVERVAEDGSAVVRVTESRGSALDTTPGRPGDGRQGTEAVVRVDSDGRVNRTSGDLSDHALEHLNVILGTGLHGPLQQGETYRVADDDSQRGERKDDDGRRIAVLGLVDLPDLKLNFEGITDGIGNGGKVARFAVESGRGERRAEQAGAEGRAVAKAGEALYRVEDGLLDRMTLRPAAAGGQEVTIRRLDTAEDGERNRRRDRDDREREERDG